MRCSTFLEYSISTLIVEGKRKRRGQWAAALAPHGRSLLYGVM
jgi:hypothetical protein